MTANGRSLGADKRQSRQLSKPAKLLSLPLGVVMRSETKDGRVPLAPGSHPSGHAASGVDDAPRFDPSRELWVAFSDDGKHIRRWGTEPFEGAHLYKCDPFACTVAGFAPGDRVRHSSRGPGIVEFVRDEALHVRFQDCPERISGVYNDDWFRACAPRGVTLTRDRDATPRRPEGAEGEASQPGPKASPNPYRSPPTKDGIHD